MNWHIHNWKLSGSLSWFIRISTAVLGYTALQSVMDANVFEFPEDPLAFFLPALLTIHYLFLFALAFRSKEVLSSAGSLIIALTAAAFTAGSLTSQSNTTIAFFAMFLIMGEVIHALFYILNKKDRPWVTGRNISLWLIAISLFLSGLLIIAVR